MNKSITKQVSDDLSSSYLRSGSFAGFNEQAREMGGDPATLIRRAGINPEILADPENLVAMRANIQLAELAAAEVGCDYFGLLWGNRQGLPVLGGIGLLAQHSVDLRTALSNISRYLHLHAPGIHFELKFDTEGSVFLVFVFRIRNSGPTKQYTERNIALAVNILRQLIGPDWTPSRVCFAHPPPKDKAPYKKIFKTQVDFSADFTGIIFNASFLQREILGADPNMARLLHDYFSMLGSTQCNDLSNQVERLINSLLKSGDYSLDAVAYRLSLSRRSLQRKLKISGVSYQQLLDKVRSKIALDHMAQRDTSISHLSSLLGYSEQSAFTRAYKKWFGTSPAKWRKNNLPS